MQEIIFRVQGSASEPYIVSFVKRANGNVSAYCTCPAGENAQSCKHRINILTGKSSGVVSDNQDAVMIVSSWLAGTDVEAAMLKLSKLEKEEERIKKELSSAKKELARAMRD